MDFADAIEDLAARQPERMVPNLERITALAELLDNPQRTYPSIHVTGTNGKTTTTRLITRILCAHGVGAGRYTSPHLSSVTERIGVCDEDIDPDAFAEEYAHLHPFLEEVDRRSDERVTYFEALTALAYLWFADKPVDAAIFEVGMGGTWDATNLVDAKVAVVREVALDHPELGSTVEEVAGEKSGIIKAGATVVVGEEPASALRVVRARAEEVGARLVVGQQDYVLSGPEPGVGGQRFSVAGLEAGYDDLFLPLFGAHQVDNAVAAIAASEAFLGRALSADALRDALGSATAPGRLEVVSRHPLVVLDGAHNPAGAAALVEALEDAFTWTRTHLVVSVLETKDVAGILAPLAGLAGVAAYACSSTNPKSLDPERMAAACDATGIAAEAYPSVAHALDAAEADAEEDDLILVTGSLYTVADARPRYVKD